MVNPKNVINVVKTMDVSPASIAKKVSVGVVMAAVEASTDVADKVYEMKVKRREGAITYLDELEKLKQKGIITQEEFEEKRKKALKKIKA